MKEHHRMYIGLIITCLLLVVGVTILIVSSTLPHDTPTSLTNQNPILPMQQDSVNQNPIHETDVQIPPPPPIPPTEYGETIPVLSDEYESITLIKGTPLTFHDTTLTLVGVNHKFQDSPDESHVWADVTAYSETAPTTVEEMVFYEDRSRDEQGARQTRRTSSSFNGYIFELTDIGYPSSINLNVRKILNES